MLTCPWDATNIRDLNLCFNLILFIFRFLSRQTHALLCLNNLFGSMDTASFGGVEKLYPVWQGLVTLSKEKNCKIFYHPFISSSLFLKSLYHL